MLVQKIKTDLYVIMEDEITLGTFDYHGGDHHFVFTPAEKDVNDGENFLLAEELEYLSKELEKINQGLE